MHGTAAEAHHPSGPLSTPPETAPGHPGQLRTSPEQFRVTQDPPDPPFYSGHDASPSPSQGPSSLSRSEENSAWDTSDHDRPARHDRPDSEARLGPRAPPRPRPHP
ncbi:hypothetical protein GCM10009591_01770 [Brachybacterium tyrofermentans]